MTATILLVDDDPVLSELVSYILKAEGYEAVVANDGEDGLRKFQTVKPDLVVLDVTMPEMNGYQACRAIKRIDPKIPIVILTAKNEAADRFWAQQSGADEFLNKPADPAHVVQVIAALAERAG